MLEKTIMLNNFDSVKEFSELAASKKYPIFLISEGKAVDAKSITEIFSLDLTKPVLMRAECEMVAELSKQIKPYLLKDEK